MKFIYRTTRFCRKDEQLNENRQRRTAACLFDLFDEGSLTRQLVLGHGNRQEQIGWIATQRVGKLGEHSQPRR